MPQKRNLSALELVRARAHIVVGLQSQILGMLAGLPSGYNMDYQETKAPFLEALHLSADSLRVVTLFAAIVKPCEARLAAACTSDMFATDRAYDLTGQGVPFRDAYRVIAHHLSHDASGDLCDRLRARSHVGAPGNLDLKALDARITHTRSAWQARRQHLDAALDALVGGTLPDPQDRDSICPSVQGFQPMALGI